MIENRPILTFFSHLILVIGVAIVALPVYVTFVASSLAVDEVLQAPMPLLPGSHLIEKSPFRCCRRSQLSTSASRFARSRSG